MSPEHARLAILLEEAARECVSRAALARKLELHATEVRDLINSRRFVTMRQALAIQKHLRVSARALLIEAAINRIDEELAKVMKK